MQPHVLGPLKVHLCERASYRLLHGSNHYRVAPFHLTQLFRKRTKPHIYQSLAQLLSERHHPATDVSRCRDPAKPYGKLEELLEGKGKRETVESRQIEDTRRIRPPVSTKQGSSQLTKSEVIITELARV